MVNNILFGQNSNRTQSWYERNKDTIKTVASVDVALSTACATFDYFDKKKELKNIYTKNNQTGALKYAFKRLNIYLVLSLLSTLVLAEFITKSGQKLTD